MYNVKTDIFEGPLDLLLHLVTKNQLDITEVSLASICGEYEEYLQKLRSLNLEVESSFISVFASLLEIKSKALLPAPPPSEEEEEPDEHELVKQLREYKRLKDSAVLLYELKEETECRFTRFNEETPDPFGDTPVLTTQVSVQDLMDAYVSVLRSLKDRGEEPTVEMKRDEISMPFMLRLLAKRIRLHSSTSLSQLFDSPPDRLRFIITFLALLEMARLRRISLVQKDARADITIINKMTESGDDYFFESEEPLAG